jgi:phospholipid N-methyltransferase
MSNAPNYHNWILDNFTPYIGKYLTEVGAGTGTFSSIVYDRFKRPMTLIEPSTEMITLLHNKLDSITNKSEIQLINNFTSSLKEIPKTDTFFYVNVLEHIEDDISELKWMFNNLETEGHICIFSPAMPFLYGSHDKQVGHFRRYTKSDLIKKVTSTGFIVKKAIYFDLLGVPLWWINFVLLKLTMKPGAIELFDKWIVPVLRKFEPHSLLPFGKNLLLVAQKKS